MKMHILNYVCLFSAILLVFNSCDLDDIYIFDTEEYKMERIKKEHPDYLILNKKEERLQAMDARIADSLHQIEEAFIAARKVIMADLEVENNNIVTISFTNVSEETTYVNSLIFQVRETAYIEGDSLTSKDTITFRRFVFGHPSSIRDILGGSSDSNSKKNDRIKALKENIKVSVLPPNRNNDISNSELNLFADELPAKTGETPSVIQKNFLESIKFKLSRGLHYKDFSDHEGVIERTLVVDKILKPHSVLEVTFGLKDKSIDTERLYFLTIETLVNYDYVERVALADFTFTAG